MHKVDLRQLHCMVLLHCTISPNLRPRQKNSYSDQLDGFPNIHALPLHAATATASGVRVSRLCEA